MDQKKNGDVDLNSFNGRDIGIEEVVEVIHGEDKETDGESGKLINPHLADLDLETVWQDYWGKYGEQLVWEGWVAKYPDQIDFEKLHAVPATAEVEVESEQADELVQDKCELEKSSNEGRGITNCNDAFESKSDPAKEELNISDRTNVMDKIKSKEFDGDENILNEINSEIKTDEKENVNQEELAHDNDIKCIPDAEVSEALTEHAYGNPASPLKYSSLSFKPVSGTNIVNTLQGKIEGFGAQCEERGDEEIDNQSDADNLANERAEMVQMMHSYSSFSTDTADCTNTGPNDNANIGQGSYYKNIENQEQECIEHDNNYDQMWEDLWNEHYTESYWYYYNQFAEKFNQLSPKHEPSAGQNGEVVFESEVIIIPDESGAITVLTDGEIFHSEVLDNNSELLGNEETGSLCNNSDLTKKSQDSKIENILCNCDTEETSDLVLSPVAGELKAGLEDTEDKEHHKGINKTDQDDKNLTMIDKEVISSLNGVTENTEKHMLNSCNNKDSPDNDNAKNDTVSIGEETGREKTQNDKTETDTVSGEDSDGESEPEDGSRKKRKKKERQERQQTQTCSAGNTGIVNKLFHI